MKKSNQVKNYIALGAGAFLLYSGAAAASWPYHVDQATTYIGQIEADNNNYGTPSSLGYADDGKLHALVQCSTFVTLLLKNSYAQVTNDALIALTGSSSPYADEWYAAIKNQNADTGIDGSGLALHKRNKVSEIVKGDILASQYTTSGNTGHVMIVDSVVLAKKDIQLPYLKPTDANVTYIPAIPNVTKVNRYLVKIHDSTESIHGNYAGNSYPDSRYQKQWNGASWEADNGIGTGYISVYANADAGANNGKLVAWAWNASISTTSFYYAVTPPVGSSYDYRPMEAGYLTGIQ